MKPMRPLVHLELTVTKFMCACESFTTSAESRGPQRRVKWTKRPSVPRATLHIEPFSKMSTIFKLTLLTLLAVWPSHLRHTENRCGVIWLHTDPCPLLLSFEGQGLLFGQGSWGHESWFNIWSKLEVLEAYADRKPSVCSSMLEVIL